MSNENVENGWGWAIRYVTVILLAIILAAALGNMGLFEKTTLGRLSAARVVEFLGYGAALMVGWMLARELTIHIRKQGGGMLSLQHLILPVVSLIVVALAHAVLLLLLKPFLSATLLSIYNWLFIIAILACAGWLVMAVLNKSAALTEMLTK